MTSTENINGLRLRELFLLVIANLVIFQNALVPLDERFRFVDEFIFVICSVYLLVGMLGSRRMETVHKRLFLLMAAFIGIGLLGNTFSDIKRTGSMVATDVIYFTKVFVSYIGAFEYFKRNPISQHCKNVIIGEAHIYLIVAFVCFCISQVSYIGMTDSVRYGIKCFQFIYSGPGMWSQYCILILLLLTLDLQWHTGRMKQRFYFVLLFTVWAGTLRARAFVTISIWLLFVFLGRTLPSRFALEVETTKSILKKFLKVKYIILAGIIVALIGWDQYQEYYGKDAESARNFLVLGGIQVMRDYYPLGSGFGTYGTEVAAQNYSPLYYRYDLSSFWALAEEGTELTDCYWPAVGAETGIFGLLVMIVIIWKFIKTFIRSASGNKYYVIATLTYSAYLLISSTATGIFSSGITAGFLSICMAMIQNGNKRNY